MDYFRVHLSDGSRMGCRHAGQWLVLFLICLACNHSLGDELLTAESVRQLTAAEAAEHRPVRLRGVITFFEETLYSRFLQDSTAGIYLRETTNVQSLVPGQLVEVQGFTSSGEYAPIVVPVHYEILGVAAMPPAQPVTFQQLASGREDSQFVEIGGIVRSVHFDETSRHFVVQIAAGGGRLAVYVERLPVAVPEALVDGTIRVRGVCSTQFNHQRQLFAIRLMVPRPEDLVVEGPEISDPFVLPAQGIESLLRFTPQGSYGHRVKVVGTVIYQQIGSLIYLQDEAEGLQVQTSQKNQLNVGDRVEVLGFPAGGQYTPILQDAVFRKLSAGSETKPVLVDQDEALQGNRDCRLVQIKARLLDRSRHSREQFLILEAGDFIFHAYLEGNQPIDAFANLENGSRILVTGVCLIDPGDWQAGANWRAKSFQILLRSVGDVTVLHAPPWWTLPRLLWAIGMLGLIVFGIAIWVFVLRRKVNEQTGIIRQQLEVEAALKERYVELFESANDIVFTHDLAGGITSINRAGERLLQHSRQQILAGNLVDLVAPDQRASAAQWLRELSHHPGPATAEWDFLASSGQRVKLEVSTRPIEGNGRQLEMEGIARDITERRHLEKEILEISNREQRRIGHDLHDGVCQQLAGIAYRLDILGDELLDKRMPEAVEAGRICSMINDAITEARSVARGLFPVRLEENGLVSALEELAVDVEKRYRVPCRFTCDVQAFSVDNDAALHLYYIAQEAVLNSVKHGRAATVNISLEQKGKRCLLSVRDDGRGFGLPGANSTGMGIRIMRHRAQAIGASLDLSSQAGYGTNMGCEFGLSPSPAVCADET